MLTENTLIDIFNIKSKKNPDRKNKKVYFACKVKIGQVVTQPLYDICDDIVEHPFTLEFERYSYHINSESTFSIPVEFYGPVIFIKNGTYQFNVDNPICGDINNHFVLKFVYGKAPDLFDNLKDCYRECNSRNSKFHMNKITKKFKSWTEGGRSIENAYYTIELFSNIAQCIKRMML